MFSTRSRLGCVEGSVAAALAALTMTGCIVGGGGGSSGGRVYGSASASLDWRIFDVGDVQMTQSLYCEDVGAGAVEITMTDRATGTPYTDSARCSDYQGMTNLVPPGTYDVTATLYGDPAVNLNSTPVLDTITSVGEPLLRGDNDLGIFSFMVNSFVLDWTVSSGGVPTTCQYVGASWVALDVWFPNQSQPTSYSLPCSSRSYDPSLGVYTFATLAIPSGTYSIQWQAVLTDANGYELGLPTYKQNYTVTAGVQANLPRVDF